MATIYYASYFDKYPYFDENIKGKAAISITETTNIGLGYPGLGRGLQYPESDLRVGFVTGFWMKKDDTVYCEVEFENIQGNDDLDYFRYGYIEASRYRLYAYPESDKGNIVHDLVQNNKVIYENNLLCAGLLTKLEAKGVKVSKSHRANLYQLQRRLEARNTKILSSSFVKVNNTGTPAGFSRYTSDLTTFMGNPGIGIAPVVVYIVMSVVIAALVSWIVFLIFKPDYTDSKADLKMSKDLTFALSHLSPEARQEVIHDLEGQIDKAYVEGKTSGSGMGMLKTAGYAGAGILGFMLLSNLVNWSNKKKT